MNKAREITESMIQKTLSYRYIVYLSVALAYFFVYFHRTSPSVMAPELAKVFNLDPAILGIFGAMYFYPYALVQLPAGILADGWGARKTISVFVFVAGLGAIIFGFAPSFSMTLVGRFLVGFGVGFVYVPAMRLLTDWFKPNEFATYSGVLLAVGNAGSLASAAPLVALMVAIGWRNAMILVGVISIAIALLCYICVRNKPADVGGATIPEILGTATGAPPTALSVGESLGVIARNYNFWTIVILFFCLYGTIMGFQGLWAGPYLQNVYSFSKAQAGTYISFIAAGMIFGCPIAGILSDKIIKSRKKVVLAGAIFYTLIWAVLALMTGSISPAGFYVIMVLFGFFGGFFIVLYANAKEHFTPQIAGTVTGFLNLFVFLGGAFFQQMMGVIIKGYAKTGGVIPVQAFKTAFMFCLITMIISTIIYATQKEHGMALVTTPQEKGVSR